MPPSSDRGATASGPFEAGSTFDAPRRALDALLHNLTGMAYRCRNDRDWTPLFISSGVLELTGYPADRFFGPGAIRYVDLMHPDDRDEVVAAIDAALQARRTFQLRYRIRTAEGVEKWVSEEGRGVIDAAGGLELVEGFVANITELKRAETVLREHDHMLTLAFTNARDMMLLARVEPGPTFRVQSVNRRYVDVIRAAGILVTAEQLVGLTFSELRTLFPLSEGTWESLMRRYRNVAEKRQAVNYDEVTETPHGLFYGQSTIAPICDDGGVCRFLLYTSSDVTSRKRAEQALQESEEKFAKAFHASPGAMAIYERGGAGFIEVNERYVEMFGYAREDLIGRTITEMGLWGSESERDKFAAEFDVHGRVRDLEVVRRRRDGVLITCLLSAEPIELGGRPRIFTSLYDITARRQTEQALRDSEERFSKAFRAVPDAVLITDPATGRVVDVNEGCFRVFGYPREECIGRTTTELELWADPADRMRLMSAVAAGGGSVRNLEFAGRTRSGARVEVIVSCETIELNGRPHLVTIAHDNTERKRAELALRDSEAKFAQSFRASPSAIGITEMDSRRYIEVNDTYCRLLGFARAEMIGRSPLELGVWANLEERERFMSEFFARGAVEDMEIVVRCKDGTLLNCILRAEKVVLGGRDHLVSALTDITARKRSEMERNALESQLRQAQKLEALGQLAGGIAHDFNNILTGISAYTDLAVMDVDRPTEVLAHLQQVRRATDRAADLVRQILTFSRQTAQERKPVRLHAILREALKLLRSSIPKSITLVERFDPVAPVVLADPTQIHQVVMNLCTNATHAMGEADGRLTVILDSLRVGGPDGATRTDLEPGIYARITVSDTGHGMDSATLARIFEPFFTTKAPGQGTGLGLSVVHGIIEDHDGVINVRSTPGAGTTFEVCLPEHGNVVVAEVEANTDLPRGNGQRVLFVDDEATIISAGSQLLTIIGYRVTAHSDPRAAWAAFEQAPDAFDAVLSDLTMPHMNGVELARRILAKRPGLPMLLATGQAMSWTTDSLRALGMRGVIAKPLTVAKLARALRDLFTDPGTESKTTR